MKADSMEAKMAKNVANGLNCFGFSTKDFCEAMSMEHRTLQQSFTSLCLAWIKTCAEFDDWMIDGRNELSVEICKELNKVLEEKGVSSLPMI